MAQLIWFVLFLVVPSALGLLGAFLLSGSTGSRCSSGRSTSFPYVTASVINAAVWEMLLNPTNGVGVGLNSIGIGFLKNVSFFGDPHLALYAVNFVVDWHWWGFLAVIYLAAMQSVDPRSTTLPRSTARTDGKSSVTSRSPAFARRSCSWHS